MISVAMAAYNGMAFLDEQLYSILVQLGPEDEIVVSDDGSTDGTAQHLFTLSKKNRRIRYLRGSRQGVVKNFENAIRHCRGDFIFLSDQDDLWLRHKVVRVMEAFDNGADLVLHDAIVTDGSFQKIAPSFFELHGSRPGYSQNLMRNSYMGCCMAFRKSLRRLALPIPPVVMHDQWLGLIAERYCKIQFLHQPLIYYRRHEGALTGKGHALPHILLSRRLRMLRETQKRFRILETLY